MSAADPETVLKGVNVRKKEIFLNGDVDAMMAGASIVQAYMEKNPDKLKVVGDKDSYEDLGFAVKKGNSELLQKINDGLANLMENGKYDELLKKWFN